MNITAKQGQSSEKDSANKELVNLFTAAMAPFVGQMTKLNKKNVSLLLSGRDRESEKDGETASAEAIEDSDHEGVDMEASLSAILDSKTTDKAALRAGDAFLQELTQDLEKVLDDKIKAKLDKYTRPENIKGLRTPKVNPLIWSELSTTMKAQDADLRKGKTLSSAP